MGEGQGEGLKEALFSRAGKEVMIKSVAQALPTYAIHASYAHHLLYSIPNSLILVKIKSSTKDTGMYWQPWVSVCRSKKDGAPDLRELRAFNLALVAKQG